MANGSLWMYFAGAGGVVKTVMFMLVVASLLSWTFIFQRLFHFRATQKALKQFEEMFWHTTDLTKLYSQLSSKSRTKNGLESIFDAGFKEFLALSNKGCVDLEKQMQAVQRAMRIASNKEIDKLERHLSFLASVGSISPYIGLFGTVWGIMTAFQALSHVQQASIAMVAPGISEALVATALGLFAAIPAVLAYNRFSNQVDRLINQYQLFQDEFSSLLIRQSL